MVSKRKEGMGVREGRGRMGKRKFASRRQRLEVETERGLHPLVWFYASSLLYMLGRCETGES